MSTPPPDRRSDGDPTDDGDRDTTRDAGDTTRATGDDTAGSAAAPTAESADAATTEAADAPALEIDGLTQRYGDLAAVEDLSITVERGEVYGFLGPNGAGKSTTINAALQFVSPTAGDVRVLGLDPATEPVAVRRRVGLLLEGFGAYPRLTGREHVEHATETKDAADDPDELLARVGLRDAADRPAGDYSKGMRQRMALAVALVGDPELLVFDEPSTGLDPNGARTLREIVREEARDGTAVFFSSHILDQVEAVADRVGILADGELIAEGSLADLRERFDTGTELTVTVTGTPDALLRRLRRQEGVAAVRARDDRIRVRCRGDGETKLAVLETVADAGVYRDFTVDRASLDDVFSRYTAEGGPVTADGTDDAVSSAGDPVSSARADGDDETAAQRKPAADGGDRA
ncbi:ATP-binding cassette domain-containing protein [Halobaculum sp. MBLA0147]|uniref:ABC transporter ATP-binding protein n=1 Tax=Halobaculum sp. MBLA0147 TaxID=3079934 RepID=UPI003525E7F6